MGVSAIDAQASLRMTMGQKTIESDIRILIDTLAELSEKPL
jgi:cysteine sulfinate desulfinase/cysteine desulfurase-like protein